MKLPRVAVWLMRCTAPPDRIDDLLGDLEEVHRERVGQRGRWWATASTNLEAVEAAMLILITRMQASDLWTISWLDVKLGVRMLVKYPGLTFVGGLAMAFAIWLGAVTFDVVRQMWHPELPIAQGDRVVAILNQDLSRGRRSAPFLTDYLFWSRHLRTLEEMGAFRDVSPNLAVAGRGTAVVEAAEITASGLALPRVLPLLGRLLTRADEEPGAASVVVLGHQLWQTRFGANPDVIGTPVALDGEPATVVGVMPKDFAFPVSHAAWVALRTGAAGLEPGEGRPLIVFGRLAAEAGRESAQAELDALEERRARVFPEALGHVRPRVMPFPLALRPLPDLGPVGLLAVNLFMMMLLVLVAGSVSLLVGARTATRSRELAVRSALGAGRRRIATQLFTEALVLGTLAAAIGLVSADYGVGLYFAMAEADSGPLPFWVSRTIGLPTVLYLCGLTALGAVIVGVVPALRATRRNVGARLRRADQRDALRIQGLWGTVIVSQIAVTVAFPATSFLVQRYVSNIQAFDFGLREGAFISARLELPSPAEGQLGPDETSAVRLASISERLKERLTEEARVSGVSFAARLPGGGLPTVRVDLDQPGAEPLGSNRASVASVDPEFFRQMGAPIVAGRGFTSSDRSASIGPVVVNRAFVDQLLRGRSAIGLRLRLPPAVGEDPGRRLEIVGVVGELEMLDADNLDVTSAPGFYQVLPADSAYPLSVAIRVRGGAEGFASQLRAIAGEVDPRLRVLDARDMSRATDSLWRESEFLYRILAGISLVALALSLTAIFSVLSLSVTQRTREIGVRVALGSSRRALLGTTLGRPLAYVAAGIALGGLLVALLTLAGSRGLTVAESGAVLLYSVGMLCVCLTACIVPSRRALRVEPMEALRVEG